jgi:hypothetical protein
MSEQKRLQNYYPGFDQDVLDRVSAVAENQRATSWDKISANLPKTKIYSTDKSDIELMDIIPREGYEYTWVYHLPMANPLSDNMQLRIATLASAHPDKRIIGIGNPSGPGQGVGKIPFSSIKTVWSGDLRAAVDPALRYLLDQGILDATHIGFSYGAEKALAATKYAENYDQRVSNGLFMEPVALKSRGLIELARDFNTSGGALSDYVEASASQPVIEANIAAGEKSRGLLGYALGLLRLSNIAIAHSLTKGSFESNLVESLKNQEQMKAHLVWGSESELSVGALMREISKRLEKDFGQNRTSSIELEGQKHAMGDDVFLHTALVSQALKKSK